MKAFFDARIRSLGRLGWTTSFAVAAAVIALGGCRSQHRPSPEVDVFSSPSPLIIAHRGASFDAPENTLAAFELAWERGADGIECDVWQTADAAIVCLHDADTGRVGEGGGLKGDGMPILGSTLAELQTVDVGRWKNERFAGQVPPLLRDVFATVPPGKRVYVEIKSEDGSGVSAVPATLRVIEQSGLDPSLITVISFDEQVVARAKRERPDLTVNWLTSFRFDRSRLQWLPTLAEVLRTLEQSRADGLGCKALTPPLTPAFVRALRRNGFGFHVWTVNDPAIAAAMIGLGVDSLTTDRPRFLREAIDGD